MSEEKNQDVVTNKDILDQFKKCNGVKRCYIGKKIAVLCNRYQYRGILLEILPNDLILANARFVEISGYCDRKKTEREDDINGPIMISLASVELVYQPKWSQGPLTNEEETFDLLKKINESSTEAK